MLTGTDFAPKWIRATIDWTSGSITTVSGGTGTSAHSELTELDYASSGHTGFAATSHSHNDLYYTETEVDTISGSLNTKIDGKADTSHTHDDRYYTETELDAGQLDNRYYTETEVNTISGSISSEIDADITTHTADTTSVHGITNTSDLALKSGNVNQLADITSAGADIEDAVTNSHAESHTVASHSDTTATGAQLNTLVGGGDTTLHDHDGISENTSSRHTRSHAVTSTSDHTAGNWKVFASNGSGEVTEITHGADSQVLTSNGSTAAPTWQTTTVSAAGDGVDYGNILTTTDTYKGSIMTVTIDDASAAFGDPLYCATNFHYERCDASSTTTMPCVGLALASGTGSQSVLLEGQVCNTDWDWSSGYLYIGTTTGDIVQAAVSGTGEQLQKIGFALSADTMYFRPDSTIVVIP